MSQWLKPLSVLYSTATSARNMIYDKGWSETIKVSKPVVSIGNITVGGTGKTPIISNFIEWAQSQGLKVGVISRGYQGKFKGVEKVREHNEGAAFFGDEPYMLYLRHKGVPIYVCPDRVLGAQTLIENENIDFILADDAYQHRRLHRDLNILVLDLMEPLSHYKVLPEGRAREDLSGTDRADFLIFNKVNLASQEQRGILTAKLVEATDCHYAPIVECNYAASTAVNMESREKRDLSSFKKVFLLSGIGRPESFAKLIRSESIEIVQHWAMKDHYEFTQKDMEKWVKESGGAPIFVTEKDAVKLKKFSEHLKSIWVVQLELDWSSEVESIYGKVLSILS